MTFKRLGINYIHPGGDWKHLCLYDREARKLCPHLSEVSESVIKDRAKRYAELGSYPSVESIKCTGNDNTCPHSAPDLWMCMTPHCLSTGCGRTKSHHGMEHHTSTNHALALKLNTLEFWCYTCTKWVGNNCTSHPSELSRARTLLSHFPASTPTLRVLQTQSKYNTKRHLERQMYMLLPTDKIYFLSAPFLLAWRKFLLGNDMPPSQIDNASLVVPLQDWGYVGCPEGLSSGVELMNPFLEPFRHFGIISETSWNALYKEYA
ncbi:Ubiquitin carboxyl-terminal hydrolase 20, partial [Podochytrium sp. JEL0797]